MAGENKCFSLVRGHAMRVTRLDGCGNPVLGPDSQVTTDGFITVGLTANTDEGTAISITNAAGKICILDEPCPVFTGYDVAVEFCGVDPALYGLMTGQPVVMDSNDDVVGFKMNSKVDACDSGFALELWSSVPAAVCEPGAGQSYGYMLIPFLKGGVIGDFTVGNDAVNFSLSGANSKDGNAWGAGPYDVMDDGTGVAGPLTDPLDPYDHLLVELTAIAPPDVECGAGELGVAATGATAGTPGSTTPANSYAPLNLAGMTGVTASPNTAWTTGQYVRTRDGSLVHWNGTAWAAGAA
jgi:hypothetical protein